MGAVVGAGGEVELVERVWSVDAAIVDVLVDIQIEHSVSM